MSRNPKTYDDIDNIIEKYFMPKMANLVFTKGHSLWQKFRKDIKTYRADTMRKVLEVSKSQQVRFMESMETLNLEQETISSYVEYQPAMLVGDIVIAKEEQLTYKNDRMAVDGIAAQVRNTMRSIQDFCAKKLWARAAAPGTEWYNINQMLSATENMGILKGNPSSLPTYWKGISVIMGSSTNPVDSVRWFKDDATNPENLLNPESDVYLIKVIQRGIAWAEYQSDSAVNMILMPDSIYDLFVTLLEPQKLDNAFSAKQADMGITALRWNGRIFVSDKDMVNAQVDDTDGQILFLNTEFIGLHLKDGAKFTADKWQALINQNGMLKKIYAYGNYILTNRQAHAILTGFYSPKRYGNFYGIE